MGYVGGMSTADGVDAAPAAPSMEGGAFRGARMAPRPTRARRVAVRSIALPRWTGYAWGAIGVTAAFIGLTYWWLTQDRSIPVWDAGVHLQAALEFHEMFRVGDLLGPFRYESPYPPLGPIVSALAVFVGGVNSYSPIIGENLVFASLLALGCYQTGRLLFGAKAGLLAVIFALGTQMVNSQLHVAMLDVPEAAVVAVTIWLLLRSEDFGRVGFAALAGLAVGAGLLIKVQYASFVMGIVLIALLRGGWRNWRGLAAFAVVPLVTAGPWYLDHLAQFSTFARNAGSNPATLPVNAPPTFSWANFSWYFWNILNTQLLVLLFALLVCGTIWMFANLVRHRHELKDPVLAARLEFMVGAFVAWLFITATPDHDIRYGIPLLPYVAVIGTGWILSLRASASVIATGVLVLGAAANILSTTIGVNGEVQVSLGNTQPWIENESFANRIRLYSSEKFLASGPERDGDVPGLLDELHSNGVQTLAWSFGQSEGTDFSFQGLESLATISGLRPVISEGAPEFAHVASIATLLHEPVGAHSPPTCTRLSNGTGVWVVRYFAPARKLALYCPRRRPSFYDVGVFR